MNNQNQIQMKKFSSLVVLMFVSFFGLAQNYKGEIKNIKQEGLHQVQLSPEVRAIANENLDFLRIFDANKSEVPYVIANFKEESVQYNSFKIISKRSIKDSVTSIVVQNETGKKINQFNLKVGNTALTKRYSISGSNDTIAWFGLVAKETLSDLVAKNGTALEKTIYFPANSYKYLRIDFNDKKSLPIDVQAIGMYENQFLSEKLVTISDFKYDIVQDKEKKQTKIIFSAGNKYQVDAITFSVLTEFYVREARIVVKKERKIKKRVEHYDEVIAYFDLNSKNDRTIYFNSLQEKEFIIEIENQDNQPLEISNIELFQKPVTIISKLKANQNYEVVIDTTLTKPQYDLQNFIKSSQIDYPKATIFNFKKIDLEKTNASEKPFWQSKAFMWICILFGIVIIGYFSIGLLKDMKN
ncbi:hypothetical protein SY27_13295 [Flavobacterium sp. 316]|nr:hypothetical protein SY27_13295 [Flavobacterium sp. 316]